MLDYRSVIESIRPQHFTHINLSLQGASPKPQQKFSTASCPETSGVDDQALLVGGFNPSEKSN